jgi:hypothetical protein
MTILYILIAVIVGWFIGFLDSNLRAAKKIRAIETSAEIAAMEAERKIAQAGQRSVNPSQPVKAQQDDPGLLRLKKVNGRHTLELDGVLVPNELTLDMRKRLVELITVFRLWLETGQSSTSVSQPVVRPSVPDPIREAVYGSTQVVNPPAPASLRNTTPPAPVPVTIQSVVQTKKPEPEKNMASLSIVQQIDTVLQARLEHTSLAGRGIRLQESIQGGVEVYVGARKFLSIDDVPDEDVKAAIRSAIAEWEKKYTPGL